ncbi:MAG: type II toxin-antitoxin system HicB family antitoxin [Clostridiales bacterium]|jgi:predicted RNase H-like HicB family nuclease|nr:type II toxin-antitoxin system HicB family antitoxin [Clostridiales bacterium]
MQYSVVIQYDKSDKIYVASVPELKGCMAHGSTMEEAIKEIQVAVQLQLEVMAEMGMQIPMPKMYGSSESIMLNAV